MPMSTEILFHDEKSHVAPHFDCFDVRNIVVPLMVLMPSHDANISPNDMT